jgi:nicotinamide phosphoribosyltransferase
MHIEEQINKILKNDDENMMLLCDFYKICHRHMYPTGTTKLYATWTPRSNEYFRESDKVIWFGLQGFIRKYLISYFNRYFFERKIEEIVEEYLFYIHYTFDESSDAGHIEALHKLGYLPIQISALPEGTKVPYRVPCVTVENTHPDFAWVTNFFETMFSSSLWMPPTSATTAWVVRQIIEKYIDLTSENIIWKHVGAGDFSFRGMPVEAAIISAAAFLTSFTKTSTIPAIKYLCNYYNADVTKEEVGSWSASVEHSVTTSNFAVDGDEETFFRKMLTELYPMKPFSYVSDSYDYFNFVNTVVRSCKELILNHKGTVRIRPDSGDPETIICGNTNADASELEKKGTLNLLWEIFGGTVNTKGYRVLNPCIGVVYGDAITITRCESICKRMMEMGYAVENVVFGIGSYSMQLRTRDSQGWAYKLTYSEIGEQPIMVFKDPITDKNSVKKSQRGMVRVYQDEAGDIVFKDGYFRGMPDVEFKEYLEDNMLEPVFENGKLLKDDKLSAIRERLHTENGGF